MSNHTPGPWLAKHRRGADDNYRTEVYSAQHGGIATCDWTPKHCGNGVTETYREANAVLIAAAPELLMALQMLYDETADYIRLNNLGGMDNQCMQLARSALALAVCAA